jgi:hypothetical protein
VLLLIFYFLLDQSFLSFLFGLIFVCLSRPGWENDLFLDDFLLKYNVSVFIIYRWLLGLRLLLLLSCQMLLSLIRILVVGIAALCSLDVPEDDSCVGAVHTVRLLMVVDCLLYLLKFILLRLKQVVTQRELSTIILVFVQVFLDNFKVFNGHL